MPAGRKPMCELKRKWIIYLFDGTKTLKQIAYITGFTECTISKVISKHIFEKQQKNQTHESKN